MVAMHTDKAMAVTDTVNLPMDMDRATVNHAMEEYTVDTLNTEDTLATLAILNHMVMVTRDTEWAAMATMEVITSSKWRSTTFSKV